MPIMPIPTITTAEQLLVLHDPGYRHELVRGELRRMSPAGYRHGNVGMRLAERLSRFVRRKRLGETFLAETGFMLERNPDTVRAPDVAFVRAGRLPDPPSSGYFPGPPDLAVEITSPSDTFTAVHEKALCWIEHGTRMVWVVDPVAKRTTVYRSAQDVRMLGNDDELTGGDVVPGFAVRVRELWPDGVG
ncbi:MAG TPA: Uma2 family endonuclease [Planctomycetota bacterium]|nr:Uma2 family endonuclease [Planctomycetota bacterium]